MGHIFRLVTFGLACASASLGWCQGGGTPPSVSVRFLQPAAKPGSVVTGTVWVKFASGLHGYQNPPADQFEIPVKLSVIENGFKLTSVRYPKGVDLSVAGESKPSKVYQDTIEIPFTMRATKKPGTYNVNVRLDYQECNAVSCFPPAFVVAKSKLTVTKTHSRVAKKP